MTLSNQTTPTTNAIKLAGKLLAGGGRYKREGNVVADIVLLMSKLGIDHLDVEREYPIGRGQADIYLPRYRTIIEAKAKGSRREARATRRAQQGARDPKKGP